VRASKSWDEFVVAWAGAFGGFDVRYAGAPRRGLLNVAYRLAAPLAHHGVRAASMNMLAIACSIAVPLVAWPGGGWPFIAAISLCLGLLASTVASGLVILHGRQTRLASFRQALTERFSELCWLIALMALGTRPWIVFVLGSLTLLHEYVRARGGVAEMRPVASNTVGDRPMRVWLTIVALVLASITAPLGPEVVAGAVTLVAMIWMVLGLIGFFQLLTIMRRVLA
jgi:CDP-diacylglycerol--glycerol-3-phosphate 3-phosphatidyltransferase